MPLSLLFPNFPLFLMSLLLSVGICLCAGRLALMLGVLDLPDPVGGRKRHERATPLVGGIASLLPVLLGAVLLLSLGGGFSVPERGLLFWVVIATAMALLVGHLDDRYHLAPTPRLLVTIGVYALAVASVPALRLEFLRFRFFDQALFLDGWSGAFTILCMVGLSNAVNMADGKNGLVSGMVLIWLVLIALHMPAAFLPWLAAAFLALAAVWVFNLRGRLFLGDAGSYGWAALLGFLSVGAYDNDFVNLSADQVALWFLIPVIDCLRLMVKRALAGRSPFSGDRDHFHHHLGRLMAWRYGLGYYLALVAVPAMLAEIWPDLTLGWAALSLAFYLPVVLYRLPDQQQVEAAA